MSAPEKPSQTDARALPTTNGSATRIAAASFAATIRAAGDAASASGCRASCPSTSFPNAAVATVRTTSGRIAGREQPVEQGVVQPRREATGRPTAPAISRGDQRQRGEAEQDEQPPLAERAAGSRGGRPPSLARPGTRRRSPASRRAARRGGAGSTAPRRARGSAPLDDADVAAERRSARPSSDLDRVDRLEPDERRSQRARAVADRRARGRAACRAPPGSRGGRPRRRACR